MLPKIVHLACNNKTTAWYHWEKLHLFLSNHQTNHTRVGDFTHPSKRRNKKSFIILVLNLVMNGQCDSPCLEGLLNRWDKSRTIISLYFAPTSRQTCYMPTTWCRSFRPAICEGKEGGSLIIGRHWSARELRGARWLLDGTDLWGEGGGFVDYWTAPSVTTPWHLWPLHK